MWGDWLGVVLAVAGACTAGALAGWWLKRKAYRAHRERVTQWERSSAIMPTCCDLCHMPVLVLKVIHEAMLRNGEEILCEKCREVVKKRNIPLRRTANG